MTTVFAMAGGVIVLIWISAGFAYRAGSKLLSIGLLALSGVAVGAIAWPSTREQLFAAFTEPPPPQTFSFGTGAQPTSRAITSRMPPNHPDPSVPRSGPHFTCHQNNTH